MYVNSPIMAGIESYYNARLLGRNEKYGERKGLLSGFGNLGIMFVGYGSGWNLMDYLSTL